MAAQGGQPPPQRDVLLQKMVESYKRVTILFRDFLLCLDTFPLFQLLELIKLV